MKRYKLWAVNTTNKFENSFLDTYNPKFLIDPSADFSFLKRDRTPVADYKIRYPNFQKSTKARIFKGKKIMILKFIANIR